MKKIFVFLFLFFVHNLFAQEIFTYDDFSYTINENNEITITEYNGYLSSVDIPSVIDGKIVTTIGESAFSLCNSLTSITIPNSVTTIGEWAFSGCKSLTNIKISESNKTFAVIDNILYDKKEKMLHTCFSKKTNVVIPKGILKINNGAFSDCSSLASVTIPDSVTTIGEKAFYYCESLTSITIPNSVTTIGDEAFSDCNSLTSITIPNSVTTIGDEAFSSCNSLTSITIPDSVTTIGESAFSDCGSLTILCNPGSYAEKYCKKNNIECLITPDGFWGIIKKKIYKIIIYFAE